jgi:hypothetical protein
MTTKPAPRGFLPDFSKYLHSDFPIEKAYGNHVLIEKLCGLLKLLPTASNPAVDLKKNGGCKKLEKLTPKDKQERAFISKCAFQEGQIYYAAFGDNPYRIVFGTDNNRRVAYFFALDTKHSIRKG